MSQVDDFEDVGREKFRRLIEKDKGLSIEFAEGTFSHYDAVVTNMNGDISYVEIKYRKQKFDTFFLERLKYDYLMELKSKRIYYCSIVSDAENDYYYIYDLDEIEDCIREKGFVRRLMQNSQLDCRSKMKVWKDVLELPTANKKPYIIPKDE